MFQLLLVIIYLAFISLGLPDSLLGSAWPAMYQEFLVPVSYAGGISMIIAVGTIVSSLQSDRLTKKFGTGKVTAASVLMTAVALFGFSISHSYVSLCLWAVPYGLGAGSVDASLNNYVALHYASRHMSWLHCMWGIGASLGPYVMGFALSGGQSWNMGYRYIAILQIALTAVLIFSLPLWKKQGTDEIGQADGETKTKPLSLRQIIKIPGAKEVMVTFFCYCALEQTTGLWASSYLVLRQGLSAETAAGFASLFFIGITVGRFFSGFLTMKLNDTQMIRLGQGFMLFGIVLLLLPFGSVTALPGLIIIGLGCAPVYPSIIHSTPEHFGADKSQAMIGIQMASAYVGICFMPPVFGFIANHISVSLFPAYLLAILALMAVMHEKMLLKVLASHR
ncbi:MFS transporter [bacterium D16-51]|nr:MFS transporter [bacterium D16-59]RKI62023.1 MFS transporter [bacterium D16-51]